MAGSDADRYVLLKGGLALPVEPIMLALELEERGFTLTKEEPDNAARPTKANGTSKGTGLQAWLTEAARERALRARCEREIREGLFVKKATAIAAQRNVILEARNKILAVPTRFRQRYPEVTSGGLVILADLLRECLEQLASGPEEETP